MANFESREYNLPELETSNSELPENVEDTVIVQTSGEIPLIAGADPVPITESEHIITGFQKLKDFVTEAAAQDIHFTVPQRLQQTNHQWANQWNALGTYLFTDLSMQQIAELYNYNTRQQLELITRTAVKKLYNASPQELQEKYQYEQFKYKKPRSTTSRLHISKVMGGNLKEALELLRAGKSKKEIKEALGLSESQMQNIRRTAMIHGEVLGYEYNGSNPRVLEHLTNPELSSDVRQEALQSLSRNALSSTVLKGSIIKLSELTREAGLNLSGPDRKLDQVVTAIQKAGLPVGVLEGKVKQYVMRYGIISAIDVDAVRKVLQEDPSLESLRKGKDPITVIGTSDRMPNASQLKKLNGYISITGILGHEVLGRMKSKKISIEDVYDDAIPGAIFRLRNSRYVEQSKREEMKEYLLNRLKEKGVID